MVNAKKANTKKPKKIITKMLKYGSGEEINSKINSLITPYNPKVPIKRKNKPNNGIRKILRLIDFFSV
jgi:hypothetical protein